VGSITPAGSDGGKGTFTQVAQLIVYHAWVDAEKLIYN